MRRRAAPIGGAFLIVLGIAGVARAGDSPAECAAEEGAWQRHIPQITEADVYRSMGNGIGDMVIGGLAAFVPSVGVEIQRGADLPALALSWSGSLPFGPVTACRTARYSHDLYELRTWRAVLDGGVVIRSSAWEYLRPGLRAIWHRSTWPVGVGAGVGSTLALMPGPHGAASISPELVVHAGDCCAPGYWLFTLRADVFFPRRYPTTASANLGFAFW